MYMGHIYSFSFRSPKGPGLGKDPGWQQRTSKSAVTSGRGYHVHQRARLPTYQQGCRGCKKTHTHTTHTHNTHTQHTHTTHTQHTHTQHTHNTHTTQHNTQHNTHTRLFHTHTHASFTHTHNSSIHTHKTLSHATLFTDTRAHTHTHSLSLCHTDNSSTYNSFTYDTCGAQPVLHHPLCVSSLAHPTSTLV